MNGIECFFEGLRLIRQSGLRQYVIVPIVINTVVLTAVISYGISQYDMLDAAISGWLPDWLQFLSWLVGLLAAIVFFALGIYCFSFIANIIAAPFNAILAEKVEERLVNGVTYPKSNPLMLLTRSVGRELAKLL